MRNFLLSIIITLLPAFSLFSQSIEWKDIQEPDQLNRRIYVKDYRTVWVDFDLLKSQLLQAPSENDVSVKLSSVAISLPNPDGGFWKFSLVESSVMAPELQALYPEIRTLTGQGIDEYREATVKLDFTLKGFHAQILISGKSYYIDPYAEDDLNTYIVYSRQAYFDSNSKSIPSCEVVGNDLNNERNQDQLYKDERIIKTEAVTGTSRAVNGTQLRKYRLALACTGEYAQFHGGTVPLAMSAMTTSLNRVNGIYERDVSVRMIMVANNNALIYLNAGTDPYTNNNGSAMLGENQTTCNSVIGAANYDIGHVFSTGGGGIAYLGSPCTFNKAKGVTGGSNPIGDPFDIDYVAHEMGHQFGANHTQNNSCNRSSGAAYEPGSASTILGYAGICPPNLQNHSDAYFHNNSYNAMVNFTVYGAGNTCAVTTSTGNTPPAVTVPAGGFSIPKQTPFELTGGSSDSDGDMITYCWEQYDLGPATASSDNNLTNPSGNAPIFRSWNPTTNPTRTFPRLSDLVNNSSVIGELLPTYARDLSFKLTVRDNAASGGGVADAQVAFSVAGSAGPFLVQTPNTAVTWGGNSTQTVTWSVANTNIAPVNCSHVNIYLSVDGGYTYPYTLATNTANTGSATIVVPNVSTSQARVKVKAASNIFFDISNQNFTIQPGGNNNYDVAFQSFSFPTGDVCGNDLIPVFSFTNLGLTTITSVQILYNLNGGTNAVYNWTGNLVTYATTTISLPQLTTGGGVNTLNILLQNPNGQPDEMLGNNSGSVSFFVNDLSGQSLPVSNNFETNFPGTGWSVVNPDGNTTWIPQSVAQNTTCLMGTAAKMNYYSYSGTGQTDDIVSPPIDLGGTSAPELTFDYSYARYSDYYSDRMQVQLQTACSETWITIWDKQNLELANAGTTTSAFVPQCSDWASENIDLSAYSGSVVQIRFRGISGYGNNLYLDNINIFENASVDCSGVLNGTATIDQCGICSGGSTGLIPNASCTDCHGVINGTAFFDNCFTCVGGNTGLSACIADCNGVFGGTATLDDCGICDSNSSNDNTTCLDCAGVVNGSASIDNCGVCAGGSTGITPNASCTDCEGVINGNAQPGSLCYSGALAGIYDSSCNCEAFGVGTLNGHVNWNTNCGNRNVKITWINQQYAELSGVANITIDEGGNFSLENLNAGTYSILVKVDGYLAKLIADVVVDAGFNSFNAGAIIAGDVNNNNLINITDISAVSASFGSISTDPTYNILADFNCDGIINIVDVSVINFNFGKVGETIGN